MKTVFLDSSVLFSAVSSPTGGSAKLFTLKQLQLTASKLVLTEVERNVRKKLLDYHLERFFLLVERMNILDTPLNSFLIKKAENVIVKKDAVIISQAKQSKTHFLLTLDRKHFLKKEVIEFMTPTKVLTPKELLNMLF